MLVRRLVNPDLIDHLVSFKVKICYAEETDRCTDAAIARSDVILGTIIGAKTFRYSISQR
jgi:hypothetical protein